MEALKKWVTIHRSCVYFNIGIVGIFINYLFLRERVRLLVRVLLLLKELVFDDAALA